MGSAGIQLTVSSLLRKCILSFSLNLAAEPQQTSKFFSELSAIAYFKAVSTIKVLGAVQKEQSFGNKDEKLRFF